LYMISEAMMINHVNTLKKVIILTIESGPFLLFFIFLITAICTSLHRGFIDGP
jgi:hypothetical protein